MMSLILALIRSNMPAALLAVLLLLGSGYGYWLRSEVKGLEVRLEDAKTRSISLERSNMSLLAALKQQNTAVAELAKRSEEKKKRTAAYRVLAHQKSLGFQKMAVDIMAFEPTGLTQCEQVKVLLEEFSRKLNDSDR